jgi:hypothetical protein
MTQEVGSQKRKGQMQMWTEFIAKGQTVNQQCYLEVLTRLRQTVRRKRPELWTDGRFSTISTMTIPLRMMH